MTVEEGKISPALAAFPPSPPPLTSPSSLLVPSSFPCPLPACFPPLSSPFLFSCPYPYSLNTARESGERCQLPRGSGQSQATKRFWCIFGLKSAHLFSIDSVYCFKTLGTSPPQLSGRGGDHPHRPLGVSACGLGITV